MSWLKVNMPTTKVFQFMFGRKRLPLWIVCRTNLSGVTSSPPHGGNEDSSKLVARTGTSGQDVRVNWMGCSCYTRR